MAFTLQFPVVQRVMSQQFLENRFFNYRPTHPGHEGIDFVVPVGTPVLACADGEVAITDPGGQTPYEGAYGIHVWIRHRQPDGTVYRTLYAHLSQIRVAVGQRVRAGDVIGLSGNSGRSTGPHLHLSLKRDNNPPNQETRFRVIRPGLIKFYGTNITWGVGEIVTYQYDYIDPTPFLTPAITVYLEKITPDNVIDVPPPITWRPDHPLRGLNGIGAADFMLQNGLRGWAVEPIYRDAANAGLPRNFEPHAAAGIRVLMQWCQSRSIAEGGSGTFPVKRGYGSFVTWCVQSITQSRGAWGHVIGNEPNRADQTPGIAITPQDVLAVYNDIWYPLPKGVRLSPPALDPTYAVVQDPLEYFRQMIRGLRGFEFLALHAYASDSANPLDAGRLVKPAWQYRGFRMWEPFAGLVYDTYPNFHRVPLLITEATPYRYSARTAWLPSDLPWLTAVLNYTHDWNHQDGDQFVHGVCMGQSAALVANGGLVQGLREGGEVA